MKAIVHTKYGSMDFLKQMEIEKPMPKDNEVLLRVFAVSLNAYDWRHVMADPFLIRFMGAGPFKPKHPVLGADVAGVIEAVGRDVKQFKPGDEVFGEIGYGGLAEFACCNENRVVLKPSNLSFEEAAAAPMAALTAFQGLRDKGKIGPGQKVLVNGASGGVGTFAVQIAKSFGAEVTGVCSPSKMQLVKSLGCVHVVDYTSEDVTKSRFKYDLIFDTAAYRPVLHYKKILNPGGKYALAGGSMARILQLMLVSMTGNKNMGLVMAKMDVKDLLLITDLLETGKIKSVIDKSYPLAKTAEAMQYLYDGKTHGKVVIKVQ
jgi:NADPH:quinone reductase-like Zn-dependent oxidoreductase